VNHSETVADALVFDDIPCPNFWSARTRYAVSVCSLSMQFIDILQPICFCLAVVLYIGNRSQATWESLRTFQG